MRVVRWRSPRMVLVQVCADFCAHRAGGRGAVKGFHCARRNWLYTNSHSPLGAPVCWCGWPVKWGGHADGGDLGRLRFLCGAVAWCLRAPRSGTFQCLVGSGCRLVGKPRTRPIRARAFTCRERAVLPPQATAAARRLDHTTTRAPTEQRAGQLLLRSWRSE